MKIVFVSNYFNHHQKPFCEAMYGKLGSNFTFISSSAMEEERKKLGYSSDDRPPYVFISYEEEQQKRKAIELINEADAVIAGSAPNDMLVERIRLGKLLLRYTERPYKKKPSFAKKIYHFFHLRKRDVWKKNVYILCAGAYTAQDFASVGMYKKRMYQWGYFPEVKEYDIQQLLSQKRHNMLLWCGRFIDWKHPDDAIRVAKKLKENGYNFCLNMIGTGVMEDELKRFVKEHNLDDVVCFMGSMPPDRVRKHMEDAGIYLFTSDRQEGWGAVLNESMNSGCAVVASNAIGAVPVLMRDGENGWIYPSENVDVLFDKVKYLLDHPTEQTRVGYKAYHTMKDIWNAEIVVERVLQLIEALLSGQRYPSLFEFGPCSIA